MTRSQVLRALKAKNLLRPAMNSGLVPVHFVKHMEMESAVKQRMRQGMLKHPAVKEVATIYNTSPREVYRVLQQMRS